MLEMWLSNERYQIAHLGSWLMTKNQESSLQMLDSVLVTQMVTL